LVIGPSSLIGGDSSREIFLVLLYLGKNAAEGLSGIDT
jgi:hypothetical protein